jgi:hypothetical protein
VDEDLEFVTLCQRGDVDAFRPLVEKHQKRMVNIAYVRQKEALSPLF